MSRGNYIWDYFPGATIQGTIIRRQLSGGNFARGQFCSGAIVHGAIILGGNCPGCNNLGGTIIQGAIVRGAIFLGANCPDTEKFPSYLGGIPTKSSQIPPRLAGSLLK